MHRGRPRIARRRASRPSSPRGVRAARRLPSSMSSRTSYVRSSRSRDHRARDARSDEVHARAEADERDDVGHSRVRLPGSSSASSALAPSPRPPSPASTAPRQFRLRLEVRDTVADARGEARDLLHGPRDREADGAHRGIGAIRGVDGTVGYPDRPSPSAHSRDPRVAPTLLITGSTSSCVPLMNAESRCRVAPSSSETHAIPHPTSDEEDREGDVDDFSGAVGEQHRAILGDDRPAPTTTPSS